jgi:putative ATP-binding cassette transporter
LGFFTVAYKYMPQIIPAAIVAPLFFRGEVEFGTVTQAAMAFAQVQGAFSLFVLQFQEVSVYLAVTDRLSAMWEATEPSAKGPPTGGPLPRMPANPLARRSPPLTAPPAVEDESPTSMIVEMASDARRLTYEHVTLWAAEPRRLLIKALDLEVTEGQPLAVTGHGEAGSALLLATAGVWEEGQGRIRRPGPGNIMFVFHRPFSASGPLRSLLLDSLGREAPDDQVHAVLADVGLADAVARQGGLDAERDWTAALSDDEHQSLTFARLLLASPRFAVVDYSADSSGNLMRERLYPALARSSITFVTVGCPPALLEHHRRRLDLREDGSWKVV